MKTFLLFAFLLVACGAEEPQAVDGGAPQADVVPVPAPPDAAVAAPAPRITYSFHYGPQTVLPGEEGVMCADVPGPDHDAWIRGWHIRMHFAHHVNIWKRTSGTPFAAPTKCLNGGNGMGTGLFGATQPDVTQFLDEAPEYKGAYIKFAPGLDFIADVHYLNSTDKPVEATVDIDFYEAEEHTTPIGGFSLSAAKSLLVPPMTTKTLTYTGASPTADLSVLSMTAHVHAHNVSTRFFVNDAEVYRSDDWASPLVKPFNSLHNGKLVIKPTDTISWSCEIANTTSANLRWANEVETGEMCNIFGLAIGPAWSYVLP